MCTKPAADHVRPRPENRRRRCQLAAVVTDWHVFFAPVPSAMAEHSFRPTVRCLDFFQVAIGPDGLGNIFCGDNDSTGVDALPLGVPIRHSIPAAGGSRLISKLPALP